MDPVFVGAFVSGFLIFLVAELIGVRNPEKGDTFTELFHWFRDRLPAPKVTLPVLAGILGGLAAWGIGHLVYG